MHAACECVHRQRASTCGQSRRRRRRGAKRAAAARRDSVRRTARGEIRRGRGDACNPDSWPPTTRPSKHARCCERGCATAAWTRGWSDADRGSEVRGTVRQVWEPTDLRPIRNEPGRPSLDLFASGQPTPSTASHRAACTRPLVGRSSTDSRRSRPERNAAPAGSSPIMRRSPQGPVARCAQRDRRPNRNGRGMQRAAKTDSRAPCVTQVRRVEGKDRKAAEKASDERLDLL